MISYIPEKGLPNGILLYTVKTPELCELQEAVARFHEFPSLGNMPFVVLGDPKNFSPEDRDALCRAQVPGFQQRTS